MTVSAADTSCADDGIYRTTFDPSAQHPCAAVVEAIETATGSRTQAVLADSIDPDTLTQLYRDDGNGSWILCFEHDGVEVTLWGSGRIHVDTEAVESSPTGTTEPSTHC
ncbi:HalOD1 output domain-containing protein [Halohasta litorea]|uniref:HalOD1 output domain-containing protein n=1 Tax=Halohasta litorea TaxID=869891 RepID=A0ABD6DA27_9EURY|nr:HalOD1 output domain-containing protein [Halohasta litorea]